MLAAAGVVLLAAGVLPALLYSYSISISAGLCGDTSHWWNVPLGLVPIGVLGAWIAQRPRRRLWALFLLPTAVVAVLLLSQYVTPSAHHYCET